MAPCMGPMSPVHAYSFWAGLCPEKLVKQNNITDYSKAGSTVQHASLRYSTTLFVAVSLCCISLHNDMKFTAEFFFIKGFRAKQLKTPKKTEIITASKSKTHYITTVWNKIFVSKNDQLKCPARWWVWLVKSAIRPHIGHTLKVQFLLFNTKTSNALPLQNSLLKLDSISELWWQWLNITHLDVMLNIE